MVSDLWTVVGCPPWVYWFILRHAERCGLRGTTREGGLILELAVPPFLTEWDWGFLPPVVQVADVPLNVRVACFKIDHEKHEFIYAGSR